MSPSLRTSALIAALLACVPAAAWSKSSDRNQDMTIESDGQNGDLNDNGVNVWTGNVVLKQGTLSIQASRAELRQRNGDPSLAILTGKQVKLRQQLDDGAWMDATADRMEYDLSGEVITFIGSYCVKSDKGSNCGQKMVYNTKTGGIQAGGDGSRVRTVIKPKSAQNKATP